MAERNRKQQRKLGRRDTSAFRHRGQCLKRLNPKTRRPRRALYLFCLAAARLRGGLQTCWIASPSPPISKAGLEFVFRRFHSQWRRCGQGLAARKGLSWFFSLPRGLLQKRLARFSSEQIIFRPVLIGLQIFFYIYIYKRIFIPSHNSFFGKNRFCSWYRGLTLAFFFLSFPPSFYVLLFFLSRRPSFPPTLGKCEPYWRGERRLRGAARAICGKISLGTAEQGSQNAPPFLVRFGRLLNITGSTAPRSGELRDISGEITGVAGKLTKSRQFQFWDYLLYS